MGKCLLDFWGVRADRSTVVVFAFALAFALLSVSAYAQDANSNSSTQQEPVENPLLNGAGILSPDFIDRKAKLPTESRHALSKIMLQISGLFRVDPQEDPSGIQRRLHRWEHPVGLWAPFLDKPGTLATELQGLLEFVHRNGGPRIKVLKSPVEAQFWFLPIEGKEIDASVAKQVANFVFEGDEKAAEIYLSQLKSKNCAHQVNVTALAEPPFDTSIARALTTVRAEAPIAEQIACVRKGFAVSMGFVHESALMGLPSWTETSTPLIVPTDLDGIMLRLFYSKNLTSGMDWSTSTQIMNSEALKFFEQSISSDGG